jgi:hypothetical protein
MTIQVQETSRTTNIQNQNRISPEHIIVKIIITENKKRKLKVVREKNQITYEGKPTKITPNFAIETLKARRTWSEVVQPLKENNFNPRILYPAKLSFKIERGIKTYHEKLKLNNM